MCVCTFTKGKTDCPRFEGVERGGAGSTSADQSLAVPVRWRWSGEAGRRLRLHRTKGAVSAELPVIVSPAHWRAGMWCSAFSSQVPGRAGKHWHLTSDRCLSSHKGAAVVAKFTTSTWVIRDPFHTCPRRQKLVIYGFAITPVKI